MPQTVRFLAALALSASIAPAFAATTTYTTQASFLANVAPGSYTNSFTGAVAAGPSFSYSGSGFGYTLTAGVGDVYLSGSIAGTNSPDETLTVTFTTGNVTAVGGNFFATNISDVFQAQPLKLTLSDGTTTTYTPATLGASYRGFVSTLPITSLVMGLPAVGFYNTMDNLTVGVGVVPETSTWVLMALGMVGLAFARRQRAG